MSFVGCIVRMLHANDGRPGAAGDTDHGRSRLEPQRIIPRLPRSAQQALLFCVDSISIGSEEEGLLCQFLVSFPFVE